MLKKVYLNYHKIVPNGNVVKSHHEIVEELFFKQLRQAVRSRDHEIVFTFDDGNLSDIKAAIELKKIGLKGIFFVIADRIGKPGYLNCQDIRMILALGHTIGSHSKSHRVFCKISDLEVEYELRESKVILEKILSDRVTHFAFPGGVYSEKHVRMALNAGYSHVFTLDEFYHSGRLSLGRMHVTNKTAKYFHWILSRNKIYYGLRSIRTKLKHFMYWLGIY